MGFGQQIDLKIHLPPAISQCLFLQAIIFKPGFPQVYS